MKKINYKIISLLFAAWFLISSYASAYVNLNYQIKINQDNLNKQQKHAILF